MMLSVKLALRDLKGTRSGLNLLAICLFLGVATLASIGSLTASILGELSARGQVILGGDIQMEVAQRLATSQEKEEFARAGTVSETVRMRAMAARADGSASLLAELKGVDTPYPLYGQLRMEMGALASRPVGNQVAIAPALAVRLNVKPGDTIRIGEARLRVIGLIAEEPDRVGEGFTLGPVALVDMAGLAATQLVQPGSLYNVRYRIKTSAGIDPALRGEAIAAKFPAGGWEVVDRSGGAPGTRRFIERLGQFLGLVGLTSLIVAGIGVGNGVNSWLEARRNAIATFKVLGAEAGTIFRVYLLEIGIVASLAILLGLVVGAAAPWVIAKLAGDVLPVSPRVALYPLPLVLAAVQGGLIALLFSLRPLARARAVTAASLFRSGVETPGAEGRAMWAASAVVGIMIVLIATLSAREPKFAALFLVSVGGLLLLLSALGVAIRQGAARLPRPSGSLSRLALANLHRPGGQTGRLVVALGLGLTLFATLATVQTSLSAQIASSIPAQAPSFFLLDIPKGEVPTLRQRVVNISPGAEVQTVPTLRGAVVALNGSRVADMKDLPPEAWFLRGDRGLTFARTLPPGSTLTAGTWWPADYRGPPLVSIDERAAQSVGLKIGDRLTVSLLGVEMEARIASFRAINWDTMGFNFVLVFSPGSIESAPYTVSATIAVEPKQEDGISRAISRDYPSVSIIKVKDVIIQVGGLLTQMGQAIAVAASLAVLAGIAVLVGAIAAARQSRIYDAVILKLQGATRFQVLGAQALEYGMLALILSVLALALGAGAGWYIMTQIFEFGFTPDWAVVVGTITAGGMLTLVFGLAGALPALAARPAAALRSL